MKQEASGWPEWCQSENDKWSYIRDYHEKEGILITGLSCGIGCYDYVGSPGFFDELFFALISHFHYLVADKMYAHDKNLVAGQHVKIFGRFGYVFNLRHVGSLSAYVVQRIYEVWQFDETAQYDPKTKTGGLFTDYVNTFLKMKQEASGWPEWCQSENALSAFSPKAIQHQFG
jgi:hypothetical protein